MKNTLRTGNSKAVAAAVVGALTTLPAASAFAESKLIGSIRIGAVFNDTDATDGEVTIGNLGSRLIWTGSNQINDGLKGIARIELGLNPDLNSGGGRSVGAGGGIDRTRQLWAGVEGGFGTIKWGAQYSAFYDMVQGNTDIAWWGSCFIEFECARETRVLKYSGSAGGLSYSASVEARADNEQEFFDEIEFGVNYTFGGWKLGLGTAIYADTTDDAGVDVDGGTLVGGVVSGDIGPGSIAVVFQSGDEDFAGADDDRTNITIGATLGNAYLVYAQGDSGSNNPLSATLGYTLNLGDNALMYFEAQTLDGDQDGVDATTIGRATFKYDF